MFQDLYFQKYILVSNTRLAHIGLQAVKFKMEPRSTSSLTALYLRIKCVYIFVCVRACICVYVYACVCVYVCVCNATYRTFY
jgi:hypothetical protein